MTLSLALLNALVDLVSFSGILFSIYPPLFVALVAYATTGTAASIYLGKVSHGVITPSTCKVSHGVRTPRVGVFMIHIGSSFRIRTLRACLGSTHGGLPHPCWLRKRAGSYRDCPAGPPHLAGLGGVVSIAAWLGS